MDLDKVVINKCKEIKDIPVSNLEDLTVLYCDAVYKNKRELAAKYIELILTKYDFLDYKEKEYIESLLLIDYGKKLYSIPIIGRLRDIYDLIIKENEAKILNPKIILNKSDKSRKIIRNLNYSINRYFSENKDLDEEMNREIDVLSSLKSLLNPKYKKAIENYI